jgi:hypothetical protein
VAQSRGICWIDNEMRRRVQWEMGNGVSLTYNCSAVFEIEKRCELILACLCYCQRVERCGTIKLDLLDLRRNARVGHTAMVCLPSRFLHWLFVLVPFDALALGEGGNNFDVLK